MVSIKESIFSDCIMLGKHQGAREVVSALQGKVDAVELLRAWEGFLEANPLPKQEPIEDEVAKQNHAAKESVLEG